MVVLKNQNRRSGIFYLRPLCGFGFFSKSDFSAIFFSHFRSSTDSFLKFSLSRLQINAKYACSVSLSWLTISPAVSSISFSGLSSGTLKKSSLCASRRSRAILRRKSKAPDGFWTPMYVHLFPLYICRLHTPVQIRLLLAFLPKRLYALLSG